MRLAFGVLLFFAVDSAVFRSGWYFRWIAPGSGLGTMARTIRGIQTVLADRQSVLVLGDSRIAEGFSAKLATEQAEMLGSPLTFTSGGIPGTLPRVWYYLLRQAVHPARRWAAVAMMTTSYHDDDAEAQADRRGDIVFVHPLLRLSDLVDFPASFQSRPGPLDAAEAILFSGLFYKSDVQDFLSHPLERIREADAWRKHGQEWIDNYPGRASSLAGLDLDIGTGKLTIDPGHTPSQPNTLAAYAASLHLNGGRFPDNALAAAYRRKWLGRIADLCQQSGIKLIVFRIPRGPLHHMADADEQPTGALAALAGAGKLDLLPASTFDDLEQPQFFFDDLHLNGAGRQIFSVELTRAVLHSLQAAK